MPVRDSQFASELIDSIRCGLVAIDARGAITALNADAQRILGSPEGEIEAALGRNCREVLKTQPNVAMLLLEALDGRDRPPRAELRAASGDGGEARTIGFTVSPVRDRDGEVRGAAILFRDLTPFERRDEQERLRERLAALGEMAAALAHEIRNPLAGMEVVVGLLKRRLVDRPDDQELLAELTNELQCVARMVTDSLDFVRPQRPVCAPTDPVELVEESLALARQRVSFAGTVERDYEDQPPMVDVDVQSIRATIANLIVNALEAMAAVAPAPAHRLHLGVHSERGDASRPGSPSLEGSGGSGPIRALVISVGDTGPGVSEELRTRIFHPFFTTKSDGSGIGIAHAHKVVASHGGAIELESRGSGATFRVALPVCGRKS